MNGSRLVRFFSPARTALRDGRIAVALTVLLAAAALAVFAALQSLRSPEPVLAPIGLASTLVRWTGTVSPPSVTQAAAVHTLVELLMAIAWTAMVLAMLTILVRGQVQAVRRGAEIGVRRAVGASGMDIVAGLLAESGFTALLALSLGATAAVLLLARAQALLPETHDGGTAGDAPGCRDGAGYPGHRGSRSYAVRARSVHAGPGAWGRAARFPRLPARDLPHSSHGKRGPSRQGRGEPRQGRARNRTESWCNSIPD